MSNLNKTFEKFFMFEGKKERIKISLEGKYSSFAHYCKGRDLNSINIEVHKYNERFSAWALLDEHSYAKHKAISAEIELHLLKWFKQCAESAWSGFHYWEQLVFFLRTDCVAPNKKQDIANASSGYARNNFFVARLLNKLVKSKHAQRMRLAETDSTSESMYAMHSFPQELADVLSEQVQKYTERYNKKAKAKVTSSELTESVILETIRELGL